MWTVNGPSSSVPELGEGIDARRLTAGRILPDRGSDLSGEGRTSGGVLGEPARFRQLGIGATASPFARSSASAASVFSSHARPIPARTSGAFVNWISR